MGYYIVTVLKPMQMTKIWSKNIDFVLSSTRCYVMLDA